jgi:Asp-tRNA(Asn)/Glu-tRNA(Gln) amidotransferase A subunit family amidase
MTGAQVSSERARLATAKPRDEQDLTWLPAWRIRELVAAREVSPVEVTDHFLKRIEALDPVLHAFRMFDADSARAQARRAEQAVMSGEPLGPLHGVPVALKEHIPVRGLAWHDLLTAKKSIAPRDAIEAERVRAAGAIVVGTTVAGLTALEFGDSDRQPLNPWSTGHVTGDSSGGSACAAASAMTPVAIAIDGLGSTRLPAAFCGLVGVHPTRGRVPSIDWGQMGSRPLSTTGPLARDVRDAATILQVLAGPDGRDVMCLQDDPPDYLAGLQAGVRGLRLAWTEDFGYAGAYAGPSAAKVIDTVRRAALRLAEAGALVEPTSRTWPDPSWAAGVVLAADPGIATRRDVPPEEVVRAREGRQAVWQAFRDALAAHDFVLSPTIQYPAPTRQEWAERWKAPSYMATYAAHTAAANLLGWPALSVPAGLIDGLPVGLQVFGRPNSEPAMLRLAQAFLELQA